MPHEYTSIKEDVLKNSRRTFQRLENFSVETIGVFGSVSRGEDTAESDIDIFSHSGKEAGRGCLPAWNLFPI
ncbi:MAG: nucleotidyltransferase domain-containing protein [Methanocorpusculum sp.]|nr:nucleotidyltransferase domain-containing protein [Methanocorpusculum sp.]